MLIWDDARCLDSPAASNISHTPMHVHENTEHAKKSSNRDGLIFRFDSSFLENRITGVRTQSLKSLLGSNFRFLVDVKVYYKLLTSE